MQNIDLIDQDGVMIQATFFKEAVERHASRMQEGKVYVLSKGLIKTANKKFTSIPNDYSITFGLDADIKEVVDSGLIKKDIGFKFVTIKEIAALPDIRTIDCIAVVLSHETAIKIWLRTGGEK